MSVDEPTDASPTSAGEEADEDGPQGVFGNLPQTRPGARSPRRDRGAKRSAKEPAKAAAPRARAEQAPESDPAERPAPGDAGDPDGGGGIEEVAWAGVAAAAEAATIGVRLATRALEAMRDAVDRR
jgi:hypothetical protein